MTKDFDAVEWMRKRRAEIDDEDRGLNWKEKTQKTLDLLRDDPLWQRLRSRVVRTASPCGNPGDLTKDV